MTKIFATVAFIALATAAGLADSKTRDCLTDQALYDYRQHKLTELYLRDADLAFRMIDVVAAKISKDKDRLRAEIASRPTDWARSGHFFLGIKVRTALRRAHLGEFQYRWLGSLDDYWVQIVEEAVRQ